MNTELTFQYPHPPTSEEAIAAFEKELGFHLPEDYRQFLLKYNGGSRPNRACFDYKFTNGRDNSSAVEEFFGLGLEDTNDLRIAQDKDTQPEYLLIIGYVLGNVLCLGISEKHRGEVYVWETSIGLDIILLANSFNEFLISLQRRIR